MKDESDVEFFNLRVWTYYDAYVSNNLVSIELFNTYSNNNIGCPRCRFCIGRNGSVNLDISQLYRFSKMIKSLIINKLNEHKEKINNDKKYTDGFSLEAKKNIYITYMWSASNNAPCIRIMIGDKVQTVLDSDKVYVPIIEFMSFYEIIEQIFHNHVNSTFNNYLAYQLKFLNDKQKNFEEMMQNLQISKSQQSISSVPESVIPVIDNISLDNDPKEPTELKESESKPEEEPVIEEKESEKQNEFDDFLKNNRDSFQIDLGDFKIENVKEEVQKKTEREIENTSKFLNDVLRNDFCNLESIITNCVNSKLPFDSFVKTVELSTGVNLYNGFSNADINSLNYLIARNIKHNVNLYINKKIKLPNATLPILVDNATNTFDTIDIMYQLFLSYVYITKIRTLLKEKVNSDSDNEDFFAYCLKTITSPIVFSFLLKVDREVFKNSIVRIYKNNLDVGFYNNFEEKIKKYKVTSFVLTDEFIQDQALRIYDSAKKMIDKLSIDNFYNNKILILKHSDFVAHSDLTLESVYNLCELDWCYIYCCGKIDNSKLNISSYDNIPLTLLKKYGLEDQKHSNEVLVRYFTINFPEFRDLEQIKKINNNVYDILDDIDIIDYPDNALKALYYWDINKLPKNISYLSFLNIVNNSSLTRNMLITMILNRVSEKDDTFYNSYLVASSI